MEENTILNSNNEPVQEPKRPQFLTVLCILTFIGCGFAIFGAIWGYISIKASSGLLENMANMEGDSFGMMSGMQDTMRKAVENAVPNLLIGVVCALLCLYGALQMWKLKRIGFYVYTVGEIVPAISGFLLGGDGLIGGAGAVVGLLFAVLWIVLYAINFKHLK